MQSLNLLTIHCCVIPCFCLLEIDYIDFREYVHHTAGVLYMFFGLSY